MREIYWDYAKGLAIIAVVMIHSTGYLLRSDHVNDDIGLILRQLINFAVPTFLFIAGYFSVSNKNISDFEYLKSRSLRILPPYIFWSLIFTGISVFLLGNPFSVSKLAYGLLFGSSIGIGYFVVVLMQFVFLTLIIKRINNKSVHIWIMIALSIIGLLYTYLLKIFLPNHFLSNFPLSALPFFIWYPFYHFGFYLKKFKPEINYKPNSYLIFSIFLAITIFEGYVLTYFFDIQFGASQIKFSSFLLSFFICILIYKNRVKTNCNKFIVYLGLNSFGIYLSHMLYVRLSNEYLSKFWLNTQMEPIGVVITTLVSICLSILTIEAIKAIFKEKSKYLVG